MPPRYALRSATLDDLDTLVLHRRRMFEDMGGSTKAQLDAADPVYRRWARVRLRSGGLVGFVVDHKGAPVASACVWRQPVQPRPSWSGPTQPYYLSVYTEPEHRGHGIATRMTKAATAWAKKERYPRFVLHASDMGRPVYAKLGWKAGREMVLKL